MAAPTLTSHAGSDWTDNAAVSEVTGALTWNAGDRILVVGFTEDQSFTLATPTATGLTFTALGSPVTLSNSCWLHAWQATAASAGSGAVTAARAGSTGVAMRGIWAFAFGNCGGFTRTNGTTVNATQTVSVTRAGANSAAVFWSGDWSGSAATVGWTPAGQTQLVAQLNSGHAAAFVARWGDQGAAGTTSYGTTGSAGSAFTKSAVEVLGAAGGGTAHTRSVDDRAGGADTATPTLPGSAGTAHTRTVADPAGLADAGGPARTDVTDSPTDSAGLADTSSRAVGYARSLADPVGLADTAATAPNFARSVADPAGMVDAAGGQLTPVGQAHTRTADDPAGLLDTATTAGVAQRAVTDPAGTQDGTQQSTASAGARQAGDTAGLTDTVTAASTTARTVTDLLALTDSAAADRAGAGSHSLTDTTGLTDMMSPAAVAGRAVDQVVGLSDTATAVLLAGHTRTDTAGLSDTVILTAGTDSVRPGPAAIRVTQAAAAVRVSPAAAAIRVGQAAAAVRVTSPETTARATAPAAAVHLTAP